jgi:hypothetical protein
MRKIKDLIIENLDKLKEEADFRPYTHQNDVRDFVVKCAIDFWGNDELQVSIDGNRYYVDDISEIKNVPVKFVVEIVYESYGISDIKLRRVEGPSKLPVKVRYFLDDSYDNTGEAEVNVIFDWSNTDTQLQKGQGQLTLGEKIYASPINEGSDIVASNLEVTINYF